MVRFQVSTRHSGRLRTLQVRVYDTYAALRRAGLAYGRRAGTATGGIGRAYGLAQTADWVRVYPSGRVRRQPPVGYMRLCRKACGVGTIAHEVTHIAVAIYKQDVAKTFPDMKREEGLCYLVGELSQKVVSGLYRHKVLK
mgnify:CR=1 FL=1